MSLMCEQDQEQTPEHPGGGKPYPVDGAGHTRCKYLASFSHVLKNGLICQDRLGTTVGKVEARKEEAAAAFFCRRLHRAVRLRPSESLRGVHLQPLRC